MSGIFAAQTSNPHSRPDAFSAQDARTDWKSAPRESRILLIRHTRLTIAPGICYGQTDIPLAPTFPAEAAVALARLPWRPSEIRTSPAARCVRLAEFLCAGAPVIQRDPRLLELNFGEWENRAWNAFRSPQSEAWARDPMNIRPPGGETGNEFHQRVGEIRSELLTRIAADKTGALRIAVVTHAGVIRSWQAHASGRSLMDFFSAPVPHAQPIAAP
ncbi:MAG: histidine phosphatase family protein [Opitutaceae bacterium]|jgi:alpha-ribazole phosphatase|nr:histidine phosphatase family protein [Opitutaceae bacterium]